MIVECIPLPTDLLENSLEWTQHRWYEVSVDQSVDMDYCHLLLHTMMMLMKSLVDCYWLVCWHRLWMMQLYYCLELIHFPCLDPNDCSILQSKINCVVHVLSLKENPLLCRIRNIVLSHKIWVLTLRVWLKTNFNNYIIYLFVFESFISSRTEFVAIHQWRNFNWKLLN